MESTARSLGLCHKTTSVHGALGQVRGRACLAPRGSDSEGMPSLRCFYATAVEVHRDGPAECTLPQAIGGLFGKTCKTGIWTSTRGARQGGWTAGKKSFQKGAGQPAMCLKASDGCGPPGSHAAVRFWLVMKCSCQFSEPVRLPFSIFSHVAANVDGQHKIAATGRVLFCRWAQSGRCCTKL